MDMAPIGSPEWKARQKTLGDQLRAAFDAPPPTYVRYALRGKAKKSPRKVKRLGVSNVHG